jgi:hypothetical protein
MSFGPALAPAADAVGVQVESLPECDIGDRRVLVEEYNQQRPLPQMRGGGARRDQPPGLGEELVREAGAVVG